MTQRILVIKLSAFGDFCLSLGTFAFLRQHHVGAHITLITTEPFKDIALKSGYFDEVRTIARWKPLALGPWLRFMRSVYASPFDAVYDMQSNDRTRILRLLSPCIMRKNWYDIRKHAARPAALPDLGPLIGTAPPDMSWLSRHATIDLPPEPFVLLVPGCAPQHPAKRWPAASYAALAQRIVMHGMTPVIIGTAAEAEAAAIISAACPQAVSLVSKTSLPDLALLGQKASAAVGNDTGPMHMIALCRCQLVSLFSHASDPAQSAPRGEHVQVLRRPDLADLSVDEVEAALIRALAQ